MRTDSPKGLARQGEPGVVLSQLALPYDRYLVHELSVGPDGVPRIRLGVTARHGSTLRSLEPANSITFNVDQIDGYGAAVKALLKKVRTGMRQAPAPEPSFAKQISLAVFQRRAS